MFKKDCKLLLILFSLVTTLFFSYSAKSQTAISIQFSEQELSNGNYEKALEIWQILSNN
jgi:hypothetical protein